MAMEREIKITVYDRDYGYGRIVVQHPDGAIYMGDDIADTVKLVEEFIKERMEGKRDGR